MTFTTTIALSVVILILWMVWTNRSSLREHLTVPGGRPLLYTPCSKSEGTRWDVVESNLRPRKDRPRAVLFVSHNYTQLPAYAALAIEAFKRYAADHSDVEFREMKHDPKSTSVSPYWLRVHDFQKLTKELPEGTVIAYFDLDTMIRPHHVQVHLADVLASIDETTKWKWHMYVGCDPYEHGIHELNSGVVVVRNTAWTRQFMDLWWSRYPQTRWRKNAVSNKWTCSDSSRSDSICAWAEQSYEQGALNQLVADNTLRCREKIAKVHRTVFSNADINEPRSFIVHLMQVDNQSRETTFRAMLRDYPK